MKKVRLLFVFIALIVIVLNGCKKSDSSDTNTSTNGKTKAVFNSSITYGTLTDQDGNTYKTVTIGTQTWMAENLRTTKYNDGSAILNVTNSTWSSIATGAYCSYNNTKNTDTIATYGRLYNWNAVNTGKLAPKGWHVPTNAEWSTLITYLGGESAAISKLKEASTTYWGTGATNATGFTALPAGYCGRNMSFNNIGLTSYWWTATERASGFAWFMSLPFDPCEVRWYNYEKDAGFSIRCIKD